MRSTVFRAAGLPIHSAVTSWQTVHCTCMHEWCAAQHRSMDCVNVNVNVNANNLLAISESVCLLHGRLLPLCYTGKQRRPGAAQEGKSTPEPIIATTGPNYRQPAPPTDHNPMQLLDSTAQSNHEFKPQNTHQHSNPARKPHHMARFPGPQLAAAKEIRGTPLRGCPQSRTTGG